MKISSSTDVHHSRLLFVSAWVLVKVDPNDFLSAFRTSDLHEKPTKG